MGKTKDAMRLTTKPQAELTEPEIKILKALEDGKAYFISELRERTGISQRMLYYYLISRRSGHPQVKRDSLLESGLVEEVEAHTVEMGGSVKRRTFRRLRISVEGKRRIR